MGSSDGDRRNGIGVEGERWRSVENGVNNIEEVKLIGFSKEFKSKEYLEREERARVFALWSWWTVLPFSEVKNPGSRTSFRDQSRRRKVMALIFNILSLRWCWSILEKFQVDSEIHEHGAKKKESSVTIEEIVQAKMADEICWEKSLVRREEVHAVRHPKM